MLAGEAGISKSVILDLDQARLGLDASIAINLLGTGVGVAILDATPAPVLMEEHAFREIRRRPLHGRDHTEDLGAWHGNGLLTVVSLFGKGKHIFEGPAGNFR